MIVDIVIRNIDVEVTHKRIKQDIMHSSDTYPQGCSMYKVLVMTSTNVRWLSVAIYNHKNNHFAFWLMNNWLNCKSHTLSEIPWQFLRNVRYP